MDEKITLMDKVPHYLRLQIVETTTLSYFLETNKAWNKEKFNSFLPNYSVDKTISILIPVKVFRIKVIKNLPLMENFQEIAA